MRIAGREIEVSRRTLLVGGGAGLGLAVALALWPRHYPNPLHVGEGETSFNAFVKIGFDGRIIVAVPQAEIGQGVYTSLPQILADELGADWNTVAVQPAPLSPIYANVLVAAQAGENAFPSAFQEIGNWAAREYATRHSLMVTGGSTSIRAFEGRMREAGAAARILLAKAAAERWGVEWEALEAKQGFIVNGGDRISFADLAADAAGQTLPEMLPLRADGENRLTGQSLPRLDLPSKVDGSAQFAGDVRLPGMVYASVRMGPIGDSRLVRVDRKAAEKVPGVVAIFENRGWAGAAATNWWAANNALEAMNPVFETRGGLIGSAEIDAALADALDGGEATRVHGQGDVAGAFGGGPVYRAHYSAGLAVNAPLETLTATARLTGDRLEIWAPTQAPGLARTAAARAAGLPEAQVTVYPMLVGGGYGRKLEMRAIEQAAAMAVELKRPLQLVWPRSQETLHDSFRPPALARMTARLADNGMIVGWQARIAAPHTNAQVIARLSGSEPGRWGTGAAVDGALPPYAIPAVAIDHLPAEIAVPTGIWRSGAVSYTNFFTECFIDELARVHGVEPLSFRMPMLGENQRLARVLATAASLGGWDGGAPGSAMGLAACSAFGSHIAALVQVSVDGGMVRVRRATCAVDCGRVINPDIVKQQIEGGLLFGIAGATGAPIIIEGGLPTARGFGSLALPRLADSPEVTVEIMPSEEAPGGITELAVPVAAPAVANALFALTGQRLRVLPLVLGSGG